MGIENFPDRLEIENKIEDKSEESDADLSGAMDFIAENIDDPHLNVDITKLSDKDLSFARKFQDGTLEEDEIKEEINKLPDGNDRSNFLAALRNKLVVRNGWKRREEQRLHEDRQNDTV